MSGKIETNLSGGQRVVFDPGSNVGTVAIGCAFEIGSRYERPELEGMSHFLEHNIFNGTKTRSKDDILRTVDDIGAIINAATNKVNTNYHVMGRGHDLPVMIDLLGDIVTHAIFPQDLFELERSTVIQEIKQSQDNPDDVFYGRLNSMLYPDQGLGRTVLGPISNISSIPHESMVNYYNLNCNADSMIIAISGEVDPDVAFKQLEDAFQDSRPGVKSPFELARFGKPVYDHIQRPEMQQTKASLVYEGVVISDSRFRPLQLGAEILGGSMSSPLMQEVRMKRGLVYHIGSSASCWPDVGTFDIEFQSSPETIDTTMRVIKETLNRFVEGLKEDDLVRIKRKFNSLLRFGQESVSSRMNGLVADMVYLGRPTTLEENIDQIEDVRLEDVKRVLGEVLARKPTMLTMGRQEVSDAYDRFTLG